MIHGDHLTTKVDGSRPEPLDGATPLLKKPDGRRGDVQVQTGTEMVHGGMTRILVLGVQNLGGPAGETLTLPGRDGVMATDTKPGMRIKRKRRRKRGETMETRGGERAVSTGLPLSGMVEATARIGPSGGAPKAGPLHQFLRALSRSLIRRLNRQLSPTPPKSTPTRITQKL